MYRNRFEKHRAREELNRRSNFNKRLEEIHGMSDEKAQYEIVWLFEDGFSHDDEGYDHLKERQAEIADNKVKVLWQGAQSGNVASLRELNNFTSDRRINDGYDEIRLSPYNCNTGHSWTVPNEYYDLVAKLIETPTSFELRIWQKPDQEILGQLTEDAIIERSLIKAKTILAIFRDGINIPLDDLTKIITLINSLHTEYGLFQSNE